MDVDLNDDGTFTINEGSTYPTTEAENCSTYSTVPAVLRMELGPVLLDLTTQTTLMFIQWDGEFHFQMFLRNLALQI